MYLDTVARAIRDRVPSSLLPAGDYDRLFHMYAVLCRAKGVAVTPSDVHDAWSAWMGSTDPAHVSLIPFSELPKVAQDQDEPFTEAIRAVAKDLATADAFSNALFPAGPPVREAAVSQTLDLYKMMVTSSEALVARRQGVNTFFLTMNGALLTASGLVVQGSGDRFLAGIGVAVLSFAGALLSLAWKSLITSFGQLNRGKFQVINALEKYLAAAVYAAEWEALGRGTDPNVYRSFTSREIWVPIALIVLHSFAFVMAILVVCLASTRYFFDSA